MRARFNQSFKIQAVEKALSRSNGTTLEQVAVALGVGHSTLQKWMAQSRAQELEVPNEPMKKEKRPQDWSLDEKLNMVIACGSLDETEFSELCREKGVFPYQVEQWKKDFPQGSAVTKSNQQAEMRELKSKNKQLEKELRRKEKALAETAALLVLQKKVNALWGNDEDSSQ